MFFLFVGSILGIFLFAILLFLLQEIGLLSEQNIFLQILWDAFKLFYNQTAVLDLSIEDNNFFDFFFKFGVTIFGILIFSTIIGIITSFISDRVQSLRAGRGKIEEENHIIFFNFSIQLIPLITELCVAYAILLRERKGKSARRGNDIENISLRGTQRKCAGGGKSLEWISLP